MHPRIYFDNAATTRMDPRVRAAAEPFDGEIHGNPSSLHLEGRRARLAVDEARAQVAALIGAQAREIVFTGSGTEADNLALLGVCAPAGTHVVVSAMEHPAVLAPCRVLRERGVEVTQVPPDADGIVRPAAVAEALRPTTRLVSVMAANNVLGTVQPVGEIAQIAHSVGALFHTDACQAAGKVPLDVVRLEIDLLSLSAHKLHGPKGVGALFVRHGVALGPIVFGGGQERGLRSATENVAGLVAFGCAAEIARLEQAQEAARLVGLRERLVEGITALAPGAYFIGHAYRRLPGHLCLGFAGFEGEAIKLLLRFDELGIAVSSGSACSAHHGSEPSSVLVAMGFDPIRARGSLRLSLGRFNTQDEVERFLTLLPEVVSTLRPTGLVHAVQQGANA